MALLSGTIISIVMKFIGPVFRALKLPFMLFMANWQGKKQGRKDAELESRRNFDETIDRGRAARRDARLRELDEDNDPNNRD